MIFMHESKLNELKKITRRSYKSYLHFMCSSLQPPSSSELFLNVELIYIMMSKKNITLVYVSLAIVFAFFLLSVLISKESFVDKKKDNKKKKDNNKKKIIKKKKIEKTTRSIVSIGEIKKGLNG